MKLYKVEWNSREWKGRCSAARIEQEPFLVIAKDEEVARKKANKYMSKYYDDFEYDIDEYEGEVIS